MHAHGQPKTVRIGLTEDMRHIRSIAHNLDRCRDTSKLQLFVVFGKGSAREIINTKYGQHRQRSKTDARANEIGSA